MWSPRERDDLLVWADELQARGDAWGELIATSLAHELAVATGELSQAEQLAAALRALEREVRDPMLAPLLDDAPEIEPIWQHGALVGLRIVDRSRERGDLLLERLAALVRLPAARFLAWLRVDAWAPKFRAVHERVPELLLATGVVARPRVIVLGSPPRHVRRNEKLSAHWRIRDFDAFERELSELERGIYSLFCESARVLLPWAVGDKGSRQRAFEQLATRLRTSPTELDRTRLARALWDPSLRVRLAALDLLAELHDDAARFVPELVLIQRGAPEWCDRARELLARLAQDPAIVERVADNFVAEQAPVVRWLAGANPVGRRAVPRIRAMLRHPPARPGWIVRELEVGLARLIDDTILDAPAPIEHDEQTGETSWLVRLRAWLGR